MSLSHLFIHTCVCSTYIHTYIHICMYIIMINILIIYAHKNTYKSCFFVLYVVPGHVNTFSGYPIDMKTIHISWAPPTVTHGNLVGYYLEYQGNQVDSDNPSPPSVRISSSSTSYELHGLYSDTLYNLTLHAENEVGRSEGVSIWLKTYKNECNEVDN